MVVHLHQGCDERAAYAGADLAPALMLRQLVAVLALFAPLVAAAQAPGAVDLRGPTTGQRALLVAGAVGGGWATAVTLPPAAPLGVIAGTYYTGRLLGLDAAVHHVLIDAAIGGAVGYGAGAGLYLYWTEVEGLDGDLSTGLGSMAFGLTVGAVTTALLYDGTQPVRLAPVTLRQPDGAAHGLAIRVGL